jgi:sucrose:sucrose fructosyltransferase
MDPRDIRSSYVALPATASDDDVITSAYSGRRRLIAGAVTSLLLIFSLLGAALYLSPQMKVDREPTVLNSNGRADPTILEPAVSRGPSDGVSEKVSAVRGPGGGFPWSNSMLQWQRTGFHFQPEKNWMNGTY